MNFLGHFHTDLHVMKIAHLHRDNPAVIEFADLIVINVNSYMESKLHYVNSEIYIMELYRAHRFAKLDCNALLPSETA